MSASIPPINERSTFSVTTSTKGDPTQTTTTTTKKKKYTVSAATAVILTGVGLTGFSVAHYTSSRGGRGDNGDGRGGGIRASVDTVEGLLVLSSVDLRNDALCIPATGTWGGKSFQSGDTHFETCYYNKLTGQECWSKSYFTCTTWEECLPAQEKGWVWLNSGAATSTCGSPCQQLTYSDDGYVPDDDRC